MRFGHAKYISCVLLATLLCGCWGGIDLGFRPVSQPMLKAKSPPPGVEGGEILVDDSSAVLLAASPPMYEQFQVRKYLLAKIYSRKGLGLAKVRVFLGSQGKIDTLEARSIAPDGTIRRLRRKDVHYRKIKSGKGAKQGNRKVVTWCD